MLANAMYLVLPWLVLVCSFGIASYIRFTPTLKSAVDHFTAGVILTALAVEILPELIDAHMPGALSLGFFLGTALMLWLKWFSARQKESGCQNQWPWGFILPVAIDLFVDGWLIILALKISSNAALILVLALSLEMLSLGAAIWMRLRSLNKPVWHCFMMSMAIGLCLLIGGIVGYGLLDGLSQSHFVICLSFGAAALFYLAAEELLVEAHHSGVQDSPAITSLLFLGAWFILMFREFIG